MLFIFLLSYVGLYLIWELKAQCARFVGNYDQNMAEMEISMFSLMYNQLKIGIVIMLP